MNLKRAIHRATKAALKIQAPVSKRVTYHQTGPSTYNPNTSTPTRPVLASFPLTQVWFSSYNTKEIDGQVVKPLDQRMTVYSESLPFDPKIQDYVIDQDGLQWEVQDYKKPTSEAIHIFRVRKP